METEKAAGAASDPPSPATARQASDPPSHKLWRDRPVMSDKFKKLDESGEEPSNFILVEIQVLLAEKRTELLNANAVAHSAS